MELEKILAQIVNGAKETLQADAAILHLLSDDATQLTVEAVSGIAAEDVNLEPTPLEHCPLDQEAIGPEEHGSWTESKYIILDDTASDARAANLPRGYRSLICAPLMDATKAIGTLHVYAVKPSQFGEKEAIQIQQITAIGAASLAISWEMEALESLKQSRERFIHIATHELRSPITVAQSLVRGVLKGYAGDMSEKQEDTFSRISRNLDFLENLVNDLLDLAASGASSMAEKMPVSLNASLGRAVLMLQPHAEEKGIALSYHTHPQELIVLGAEDGLDSIFTNLIGNAIKYTPPGGLVSVIVTVEDEEIEIEISDTGIGIPEDAIPELFDEFYRAPNAKKSNVVGTGLGLAIVKNLVSAYGGNIRVESKINEGTTFTVTLPIAEW